MQVAVQEACRKLPRKPTPQANAKPDAWIAPQRASNHGVSGRSGGIAIAMAGEFRGLRLAMWAIRAILHLAQRVRIAQTIRCALAVQTFP
jgi:hypothetical protein